MVAGPLRGDQVAVAGQLHRVRHEHLGHRRPVHQATRYGLLELQLRERDLPNHLSPSVRTTGRPPFSAIAEKYTCAKVYFKEFTRP
ncbi:hypothetical protein GCM10010440_30100 [Kitasatospora cinereorecta]